MRVIVISDMEGVAGIVKWEQVRGGSPMFEEARRLYTEEVNAAVRGACEGGATEVVVMDCHGAGKDWSFNSLIPDQLDPGCEYVVQSRWTEYTEMLEQGCDAALLVAMHAKAGTPDAVLSHTVSNSQWQRLQFNGVEVGEIGINAALCGTWGVPVLLVTGDEATCREAEALLGEDLTTVAVKRSFGRFSARQIAPLRARELIQAGAAKAVLERAPVKPYDPGRPCEIVVDFHNPDGVEPYRNRAGVEIRGACTIVSQAGDWWTAWRQFYL